MVEYLPVIIAIIAGPLVAVTTARMSRPKVRADATKTLTDISLSLVEPQMNRIAELEKRVAEMHDELEKLAGENAALHTWAQLLYSQVLELGTDPIPFDSDFIPRR